MSIHDNIRLLKLQNALIGFLPASAIFILYFTEVAGSVAGGAAVFTVAMVFAALVDIPAGMFSDRVGRRVTAITGTSIVTVSLVVYAAAPNWETLLVAAALDGVGMGLWSGNTSALLYESLEDIGESDRLAHETGRLHGAMHWSAAAASVVGGLLAMHSLQWAMWACVPSHVVAIGIAWRLCEPRRRPQAASARAHLRGTFELFRRDRALMALAIASIATTGFSMGTFVLRATWSTLLWPLWAVGAARCGSAVFAAIGTWWGGYFIRRFGAVKALVMSQSAASATAFAALGIPTVVSPGLLTSSSLAYGIGTTADNVLLQGHFSDEQRATMASFVALGGRLLFGIVTVLLGALADAVSPGAALLAAESLLIAALPLYLVYERRARLTTV